MPEYTVLADAHVKMEKVEGFDKPVGITYKRGDVIELTEQEAAGYLKHRRSIAPVDSDAADAATGDADEATDGPPATEAPVLSGTAAGESAEGSEDDDVDLDDDQQQGVVDTDYDSLPYADLQQAAKSRGISAGGSREEIAERLREDDVDRATSH